MAKRTLRRLAMGCLVGMPVGTFVLVFLSYANVGGVLFFTDVLLRRVGSEASALLVQTVLSGVIGAVGMGGTVFFDIEGWSVPKSALAHFANYTMVCIPIGFYLGWLEGPIDALAAVAVFAAAELGITLIMIARYKAQVKVLNDLLASNGQR